MNRKNLARAAATASLWLAPLSVLAQSVDDVQFSLIDVPLIPAIFAIINGVLILVGIAALIVLIIGGVQYIVSAGNEDTVGKAKNTILYAVVGLIVVALALAITSFIANTVIGNAGG